VKGRTIVIGLGNTILSDDGLGIYASRHIAERCKASADIDVVEASLGGVGLLDLMIGYESVIIVDAVFTSKNKPGLIYQLDVDDLGDPTYPSGPHFLDVRTSVELGRRLGLAMPKKIKIFAIEIKDNTTFSEKLTQEVEQALPFLTQKVLEFLKVDS
jgi:hydrogenase maturation protease